MTLDLLGSADILRGTAGVLEVVLSVDGVPTDPEPSPDPQVTVVDAAGTLVVTPALAIALGGGSGKLRFIVTPDKTTQVAEWLATWSFTQGGVPQSVATYHRVVGELLFPLAEARTYDGGALANSATYSDAAILAARDRIADAFAEICGVAFGAYADWVAGTQAQLVLTFTSPTTIAGGGPFKLTVTIPKVAYRGSTPKVGGPEIVMQPRPFKALADGENPVITIEQRTTDTAA